MSYLINLAERGQNTLLGAELVERGERIREQLAIYADIEERRAEVTAKIAILNYEDGDDDFVWLEAWGEQPSIEDLNYDHLDSERFDLNEEAAEVLDALVPLLSDEEI